MKRVAISIFAIMLLAAPASLFAWDSVYEKGDLALSATASFIFPLGLAVYPGAEMILAQVNIADELPLDFGLAARGQVGFASWGSYGYTTFGGGAFGTAHLSFANMGDHALSFLNNFDFYVSLGISFNYFAWNGTWITSDSDFQIGAASFEGVDWYLSDSFALKLEYVYWNYIGSSATLGVQLKL